MGPKSLKTTAVCNSQFCQCGCWVYSQYAR